MAISHIHILTQLRPEIVGFDSLYHTDRDEVGSGVVMEIDKSFCVSLRQAHALPPLSFGQGVLFPILLNLRDGDVVHARAKIKFVEVVKGNGLLNGNCGLWFVHVRESTTIAKGPLIGFKFEMSSY